MTIRHQGETCAEAIESSLARGEVVAYSELFSRVRQKGSWKNETVWQNLMAVIVNLPPARYHWHSVKPFLFLHGDGRYELYDPQKHPKPVE